MFSLLLTSSILLLLLFKYLLNYTKFSTVTFKQETGFSPWWGRSPGEVNGTPFQYSCLRNPKDRGSW